MAVAVGRYGGLALGLEKVPAALSDRTECYDRDSGRPCNLAKFSWLM